MTTLRDIFDWWNMQQQNKQHYMLAQSRMDAMRESAAQQMGSRVPYTEQAPFGAVRNYTDSLPFTLSDRLFYKAPGLWDQMNNKQPEVSLDNMFKPAPKYTGTL